MPSQMSGINGTNNRYKHINNKIMSYSALENNNNNSHNHNGPDQYRTSDLMTVNNNNVPSINMLEQGMAELYTFSVPMTSSAMVEEYRLRLGSEDLGHHRSSISSLRRSSMIDGGDGDLISSSSSSYFGLNRVLSENMCQWSHDSIDESRLRDCCAKEAQQAGFIVGDELELVKAKSHRSVIQTTPDRIISSFKDRYGQSDSTSKKTYLQLGVRVPTKEHVSEIVGKQGSKIKQIREKTGALITTPGEQEDHVFIIEAPPRTALHVAQILKSRAEDITMSRTQESRRRTSCPPNNVNRLSNKCTTIAGFIQSSAKVILASGRIQVPKIIVGRIIGTQGSIITTIQRDTGTEIRSPPKEIGKPKHALADFEILVYQTATMTDLHEAKQRVLNAKQLIAHVAMHQLEKIRAEEAPYSNYQVQSSNSILNSSGNDTVTGDDCNSRRRMTMFVDESSSIQQCFGAGSAVGKDQLITEKMKPFDWIWHDVDKLDDFLAHEVVDRILEESKKKTKTRSEPSIYDSSGNNLFTLGESDTFSNGSSEISRPRHSLPETKVGAISGMGIDCFYRPNFQSTLPSFSVNDNFLMPDGEGDFRSSPSMSFVNRREIGSRSDLSEHEGLGFQTQDFIDNLNYNNGCLFPKSRDINEQALMQHLYMNNGAEMSGNGNNNLNGNRNFNRFVIDQNFSKVDFLQPPLSSSNSSSYYPIFPVDNSHWNFSDQGGSVTTNNGHHMNSGMNLTTAATKSYADSVKPLTNYMGASFSTQHGTIGDHLKKTNNYKG